MNELYELKDRLMKELEEYGRKGDLSAGSLEVVDKLAHTVKNLCKVIEDMEDEGYSNTYGRSYARKRDSMGRYSRDGYSMARRLRDMSYDAPDEQTRREMERLASKVETM